MTKGEYDDAVARAKAICKNCVVQQQCKEEGEEMEYGIWGGIVR
jgi:hypothetical protein